MYPMAGITSYNRSLTCYTYMAGEEGLEKSKTKQDTKLTA